MAEANITKETKDKVCGVTSSGFEFEVKKDVLDNVEFVDALSEMDDDDVPNYGKICTMLIGKVQKKKLYDFFRTEDGRVPIDPVNEAILEIMGSTTAGKNS